jgi:phage shock protein PspC (stress-responsive transcriptional regulator)
MADASKRCPYCAEEIRAEARKCRYCGSLVEGGSPVSRTWYRVSDSKMIAGVCAGLAEQFDVSVTIVRLAFLLSALLGGGVGIIIYIALWVVMPSRGSAALGGSNVARVEQRSDPEHSARP